MNDGVVVTDGPLVDFGKLTHFNRPIADPAVLEFVQIDWSLQLFAAPGDAAANVNPVRTINLAFTLYNWETPNLPADNPAYLVSYDNGATWTTIGPGVCAGSTPAGTLIVGPLGKIYQSAFTDQPAYPPWNGECGDAHIYEGGPGNANPSRMTAGSTGSSSSASTDRSATSPKRSGRARTTSASGPSNSGSWRSRRGRRFP